MRALHHRQEERQANHGMTRLIGLELRADFRYQGGIIEELMMIPLDIELIHTANAACPIIFGQHTLHTSHGDLTIPSIEIPARW